MYFRLLLITFLCAMVWAGFTSGASAAEGDQRPLLRLLKNELTQKFPGARIQLNGELHLTRAGADIHGVAVTQVTPRGEVQFSGPEIEGWSTFSAYMPAKIATKRILPGEHLSADQFTTQEINVASGNAYEYRGVILGADSQINGLETRQTVLEGQFLTSTAVQRVPDIRRGDSVRLRLVSGDLVISTAGSAEEPAYLNGRVHVMASKTKREFVGNLLPGGLVEVQL